MAENINLATFEFDTAKLQQSLGTLQDTMFKLKKENESLTQSYRDAQKEINEINKVQALLVKSGQQTGDSYKENVKRLEELNGIQQKTYKAQQDTATQMGRVRQEITATNTQLKAYMNTEAQQNSLIENGNRVLATQVTNINQARASNTELLRVRNQLNPLIAEEAEMLTLLNNRLDENNAFIKENASAYEQQKINIGNYTESIQNAFADLNIFNGGLSGFAARAQEAGGASNLLSNSLKSTSTAVIGLTKSMLAFLLTPIGAAIAVIAGLFLLVKNAMDKNVESADKVTSVFKALGAIFNSVLKAVEPLGTFIIDVLVAAFEMLGNAAEEAMGMVSAGLSFLGFDEAAKSVDNFTESTKESTKQAYELAKAERELEQAQARARLVQLEYQKGAEKLRQIRDDESRSLKDRTQANRDLGALLDEQAARELAIAQQAVKVAEMRAAAAKLDKTIQLDYIEALTQVADIEERITGQRSEMLANENSLRRDAAAEAKAIADKQAAEAQKKMDAAIKAMQTELDFYLESQGDSKKSMKEQVEIDRETMRQSLAIAKAEFDAKKMTRREYELSVLEIQNEFAYKQRELAVANADIEFELFKLNHQRKLEENTFFSEQLYQQELERIAKIDQAERDALQFRFDNGLINAAEYNLALEQLDATNRENKAAADAEREQAIKDQQAADIAIQDELNAERFEYDLALQMERYEREYAERKAIAEKNGADMVAFEKAEAAKKIAIERQVQQNKMQLASDAFGNIASLLGESTAAGKAAGVAQATIDTYASAVAAYNSLSGIPIVGPALGAVAAGVAVAAGIANVKKILSVKTDTKGSGQNRPSYNRGYMVTGAGTGTSDSMVANVSAREPILTARAFEMFPNEIAAINQAGGGVGLNGMLQGSSSAMVQDSIRSAADSSINMDAIADAVARGAAIGTHTGSQEGIRNLSSDRKIMQDAQF